MKRRRKESGMEGRRKSKRKVSKIREKYRDQTRVK